MTTDEHRLTLLILVLNPTGLARRHESQPARRWRVPLGAVCRSLACPPSYHTAHV